MNRPVIKFAVLGFAIIAATVLTLAGPGRNMEKRAFNPAGTPPSPAFSNGLLVGNTLYLSWSLRAFRCPIWLR